MRPRKNGETRVAIERAKRDHRPEGRAGGEEKGGKAREAGKREGKRGKVRELLRGCSKDENAVVRATALSSPPFHFKTLRAWHRFLRFARSPTSRLFFYACEIRIKRPTTVVSFARRASTREGKQPLFHAIIPLPPRPYTYPPSPFSAGPYHSVRLPYSGSSA